MYNKKMSGKENFFVVIHTGNTKYCAHIMYRNGWIDVSLQLYKEPPVERLPFFTHNIKVCQTREKTTKINAMAQILPCQKAQF
jgi:hypothetical protein